MSTDDSIRLARVRALRDELAEGSAVFRTVAEWLTEALEDDVETVPLMEVPEVHG